MKNVYIFTIISICSFLSLFFFVISTKDINAANYQVNATISISVCGDGIVEGVEQCEPTTFTTLSCKSAGYDTGDISCDPSCAYNYSSCGYKPPKPILPPYPNIYNPGDNSKPILPTFLAIYDINSDGKLSITEYCDGLTYWLKKWRLRIVDERPEGDIKQIMAEKDTCDLNLDKNCNLVDLSIFLHNAN